MVLNAHRVPGLDEDDVPTPAQVLRMATIGGARTTPYGTTIGTLAVGNAADLVVIDGDQIASPYLDPETPLLHALVHRAKSGSVMLTMCDGEVIYDRGRFTRVDQEAALTALRQDLHKGLADDEVERRGLAKALLPFAKAFYRKYFDPERHDPFYRTSSKS